MHTIETIQPLFSLGHSTSSVALAAWCLYAPAYPKMKRIFTSYFENPWVWKKVWFEGFWVIGFTYSALRDQVLWKESQKTVPKSQQMSKYGSSNLRWSCLNTQMWDYTENRLWNPNELLAGPWVLLSYRSVGRGLWLRPIQESCSLHLELLLKVCGGWMCHAEHVLCTKREKLTTETSIMLSWYSLKSSVFLTQQKTLNRTHPDVFSVVLKQFSFIFGG